MESEITLRTIRPVDLPAPPQQALRLVHACTQPNISNDQLAALVSHEPILTAEILRVANSAYFGFSKEVNSVARAITVLGHRGLRNLALCVAMKNAMKVESVPGFDMQQFWEDALRRAVSAKMLAQFNEQDKDAAFTAGLLADFGLFVLIFLRKEEAGEWDKWVRLNPLERREEEFKTFGTTHDAVALLVAEAWNLPEDLKMAIGMHHQDRVEYSKLESKGLCDIVRCADWVAALFSTTDKRTALEHTRKLLKEIFNITAESSDEILQSVSENVTAAAVALGIHVGAQPTFESILRDANVRLIEENISYQELTWKLEQTLKERDCYASELQRELSLAREVQKSLLPTDDPAVKGLIGINISAKEVSGDFYDYFPLADGRFYFCIADVSGKGMNAALLMAKTSSLFHCLGKSMPAPSDLLAQVNHEIMETSIRGMFVTLVGGIYDPAKDSLLMANAGHLPVLVMGIDGAIEEYAALGPPLGIMEDSEFPSVEVALHGGTAYLYTDGLIEAKTPDGQRVELAGLLRLIQQHQSLSACQRMHKITDAIQAGREQLDDDLTLLLINQKASVEHG